MTTLEFFGWLALSVIAGYIVLLAGLAIDHYLYLRRLDH